jgi:NADPH-dependent ferric siderophore reductase
MSIGHVLIGALEGLAADAELRRSKADFVRHGVALLRGLAQERWLPRSAAQAAFREMLHEMHETPLKAAREHLEACDPGSVPALCAEVRSQLRT